MNLCPGPYNLHYCPYENPVKVSENNVEHECNKCSKINGKLRKLKVKTDNTPDDEPVFTLDEIRFKLNQRRERIAEGLDYYRNPLTPE